jgi:hypothetical protein
MDTAGNLTWRKSTYSGGTNTECVEIGSWRKSSYSGGGNSECLEAGSWHKSTYSGGGGSTECLEAGLADPSRVLVRDTKNRDGGTLTFAPGAWAAFTATLKR